MGNVLIERLKNGTDLKNYIIDLAKAKSIEAGVIVSTVGSLKELNIRLSDLSTLHSKKKFEILSLNGTLSKDRVHLHICVSDEEGKVLGGHLLTECIIDTTCELVIQILDAKFLSEFDENTGFNELKIIK